ncbi:MAG TPA: rhodanese-like domain-containing protein [Candidatus Limnocylindria bacterium]|jgi:rhodanese-related sulfurtransferase|nr:rhodanese-like domain-containing protein [Candidatus Limnocylindria bacterium]
METTTVEELRRLGETGATVINVGSHAGSREIRGAIRYRPHDLLVPERLALPLAPEKPVVLYDQHGNDAHTAEIAEKLRANGYRDVRTLEGGFAAWEGAGGPTQEPSFEQVVPPVRRDQVQELDRRV